MLPANWFCKLSNRFSTQWTGNIQNVGLDTGHYNILLLFAWHWLPRMMNILRSQINSKHIRLVTGIQLTTLLQKELIKIISVHINMILLQKLHKKLFF